MPDPALHARPFRLGPWTVEPMRNRLRRASEDEEQTVEPRVMQVLVVLAEQAGAVVTREALLATVWDDVVVNEDVLTRAVSELRKHLGDDPRAPAFIETIRGRGYRLMRPVVPVEAEAPPEVTPAFAGDGQQRPTEPPSPPAPWHMGRGVVAGVLGLLGLLVIGAVVGWWGWRAARPAPLPEPVPWTSFPGHERTPALSPDGRMVAYSYDDGTGDDVYVLQRDTATPLRLTDAPGYDGQPAWSPDGSTLAYVRAEEGGRLGLYAAPVLGGPPRRLGDLGVGARGLSWLADGTGLVAAVRPQSGVPYHLARFDLATRTLTPLTTPPAQHAGDFTPAVSPDGRRIAFVRSDRAGVRDLYVMPTEGGAVEPLTREGRPIRGLTWTADGRGVVYAGLRNGTYSLWRVDVASGRIDWVPARGERAYSPSIARETGALVYEELWFEKNVWAIRFDGSPGAPGTAHTTAPLIVSTRWDCEAYLDPQQERLVFSSARSGDLELWLSDADGQQPVQLTRFGGPFVGYPRWAPDGRRVAFSASPDGPAALYVLDVEGGLPRRLTTGGANAIAGSWSRDGRWIYFASDRSGTWQVWKVAPKGGAPVPVTTDGGLTAQESIDGRTLFFTRPDAPGIWRRPVEGGEAEQVVADLGLVNETNWTVTAEGLYYVRRTADGPVAALHRFTDGETRDLAPLVNLAAPSFSVSADGRTVLYARVERSESDLMGLDQVE